MRDNLKSEIERMSEQEIESLYRLVSAKRDRYAFMRAERIVKEMPEDDAEEIVELAREGKLTAMRHLERSREKITVPVARYVVNLLLAKAS